MPAKNQQPSLAVKQWLRGQLGAKPDDAVVKALNSDPRMNGFWLAVSDFPDPVIIDILESLITLTTMVNQIRLFADCKHQPDVHTLAKVLGKAASAAHGLDYQEVSRPGGPVGDFTRRANFEEEYTNPNCGWQRWNRFLGELAFFEAKAQEYAKARDTLDGWIRQYTNRGDGNAMRSAFLDMCEAWLNSVSEKHGVEISQKRRSRIESVFCRIVLASEISEAAIYQRHRRRRATPTTEC